MSLSNAQFRDFLNKEESIKDVIAAEDRKHKDARKRAKVSEFHAKNQVTRAKKKSAWLERQAEKEKEKAKYRDRAEERRKGINLDYKASESLLESNPDAINYVGGSMKFTHLVKGLDYELLRKVREQNVEKEKTKLKEDQQHLIEEKKLVFKSHDARKVYEFVCGEKAPSMNRIFLPGHSSYSFSLTEEESTMQAIPSQVIHSKDEIDELDLYPIKLQDELMETVLEAFSTAKNKHKHKPKTKKKKAVALYKNPANDEDFSDDDDIFGGVKGDYIAPALKKKQEEEDYMDMDMDIDEPFPHESSKHHRGNHHDTSVSSSSRHHRSDRDYNRDRDRSRRSNGGDRDRDSDRYYRDSRDSHHHHRSSHRDRERDMQPAFKRPRNY